MKTKIKNLIFQIRLKRAIRMANEYHNLTKHKYMVLLYNGKLIVKSKKNLKHLIRTKKLNCTVEHLHKIALHTTP